jgi:large subunit ribosomal protein L1
MLIGIFDGNYKERLMKRGKNYRAIAEKIDRTQTYTVQEAVKLLREVKFAKFDESVSLDIRLGIDPRRADQQVRGTVVLPHGTGKKVRVAVFVKGEKAHEALEAGADFVGAEDLAEKIKGGWLGFEAAVATPDMMRVVGKLGKILGPRGLMPNPKTGTVTFDLGRAIKDIKAGRVEYRLDRYAIVHCAIGKMSFTDEQLTENALTLIQVLLKAKPATARGQYVRSMTISSTMSPGIRLEPSKISAA